MVICKKPMPYKKYDIGLYKKDYPFLVYLHKIHIEKGNREKYYVGITRKKYFYERWGKRGERYNKQFFYNAILKYGWENFTHYILAYNCTKEEACELEKKYIIKYKSLFGENGYNMSEGGEITTENNRNYAPIACLETMTVYKSKRIASEELGDNEKDIEYFFKGEYNPNRISRTCKYHYLKMKDFNFLDGGGKLSIRTVRLIDDRYFSSNILAHDISRKKEGKNQSNKARLSLEELFDYYKNPNSEFKQKEIKYHKLYFAELKDYMYFNNTIKIITKKEELEGMK